MKIILKFESLAIINGSKDTKQLVLCDSFLQDFKDYKLVSTEYQQFGDREGEK